MLAICFAAPNARPDLCGMENCDDWTMDDVHGAFGEQRWESDSHNNVANQVSEGLAYWQRQLDRTPDCSCRGFRYREEADCCWARMCATPELFVQHHGNPYGSAAGIRLACSMSEIAYGMRGFTGK